MKINILLFILFSIHLSCASQSAKAPSSLEMGASQFERYLPLLKDKKVGIVANATSMVGSTHLVDTLLSQKVQIIKVFAPEHGFRGNHGAGDHVSDEKDAKTGLPLISLYGKNKKPSVEMLKGLEVVVFDIQDVGARFYTYISTMHYVMEACAENKIPVIVLDRPNPNGFYIDGPVLDPKFKSFVGMHPIPVVHGCTVGELAQMINGEKWLAGGITCNLTVVSMKGYDHKTLYELPVAPSPNLPNMSAIYSYPSLCFFEGTNISVGRGTEYPFQCFGSPTNKTGKFAFTPQDIPGVVKDAPYKGQLCKGHLVKEFGEFYFPTHKEIYLNWLVDTYNTCDDKSNFFSSADFFDKLMGNSSVRENIIKGATGEEIRKTWTQELEEYKKMRKKYILYQDFE